MKYLICILAVIAFVSSEETSVKEKKISKRCSISPSSCGGNVPSPAYGLPAETSSNTFAQDSGSTSGFGFSKELNIGGHQFSKSVDISGQFNAGEFSKDVNVGHNFGTGEGLNVNTGSVPSGGDFNNFNGFTGGADVGVNTGFTGQTGLSQGFESTGANLNLGVSGQSFQSDFSSQNVGFNAVPINPCGGCGGGVVRPQCGGCVQPQPQPLPVEPRVITKTIRVPHPVPVPVEKRVPYPVKVNVPVPVNRPYPVYITKPVPVTVVKKVHVPVDRPYPVHIKVPVQVPVIQKISVPVPKPYPVEVPKPYPVRVPHPVVVEKKVPYPVYRTQQVSSCAMTNTCAPVNPCPCQQSYSSNCDCAPNYKKK